MHARVSTYSGTAEQLDRLIQGFDHARSDILATEGFQEAYILVDRSSGRATTITLWDSEQAVQASVEKANQLRARAAEHSGHSIEGVTTYEVGLHLTST